MNYITEIRAFYDWLETNQLQTSEIVLWHALMHIANKTRWQDKFAVALSVLKVKTGLQKDAIYNARNELKKAGRIRWQSQSGNQSAIYEIVSFESDEQTQEATQDYTVSVKPTQPPTQSATQLPTQSATINKLNETKLNETNNNSSLVSSLENSGVDKPPPKTQSEKKNEQRRKYGMYSNVLLSDEDVSKLKTEFPDDWKIRIERLSEYIASKGVKYASHLATIRKWARNDIERVNQQTKNALNKEYKDFDEVFGNGN